MVPYSADVTNVLWYNKPAPRGGRRHAAHDLGGAARRVRRAQRRRASSRSRPATRTCGRRATGSATWRRASWARRSTRRPSAAPASSTRPEWEKAFGYIAELADAQVRQRQRQRDRRQRRRAAVLPGQGRDAPDRVVAGELGDRRGARPRLRLRQPAGDAGRRPATRAASSASRRATWSTPRAPSITEAIDFLALLNSAENVQKLIEAEVNAAREVGLGRPGHRHPVRGAERRCSTPRRPSVLPPDTGYDLEMADALYAADRRGPRRPGDAGGGARRDRHASSAARPARDEAPMRPAVRVTAGGRPPLLRCPPSTG